MIETAATFYREGGIFMHFILAVSVIGVAIAIERWLVLMHMYTVDSRALWGKVSRLIMEGEMEKARGLCKDTKVPLLRVLSAGIMASSKSERDIQDAVDEVALEVLPLIDKRIPYLASLANIATLLGLLGTIQGLIQSFHAIGGADPTQKAAILAVGIAIALNTTFFGLIVAIPLLIMHSFYQAKAHRILSEIDEFSVKLINLLSRGKHGSQAE